MRPEPGIAAYLWDALDFAKNVQVAISDTTLETYLEGGPVAWATERQIELVGEALNNLRKADPEVAEGVPDVHKIIGMRNVLVHGYADVNSTIVWQAATQSVPTLIPTLEALLAEMAPDQTANRSGPADADSGTESVILQGYCRRRAEVRNLCRYRSRGAPRSHQSICGSSLMTRAATSTDDRLQNFHSSFAARE